MDATRRIKPLRRVATTASLAALILLPAGAAEAKKTPKSPVITKVTPLQAKIGGKLTIKGRHFRVGKNKNSVGFKRDGAAVVFVRSDLSTEKTMTVRLSPKLEKVMYGSPTTFKLRVLARRFGKRYTSAKLSPTITPRPADPNDPDTPAVDPTSPQLDCDNDGTNNGNDNDDDNDGLSDEHEGQLGTDGCKADSDADTIVDGYEFRSAVDLNNDEYQHPNQVLPYPGKRPYPNPLDGSDAGLDHDGDGLTMAQEEQLWRYSTPDDRETDFELPSGSNRATPLSYSDGLQYSVAEKCPTAANATWCNDRDANMRVPTLATASYQKFAEFKAWATDAGYLPTVRLHDLNWVSPIANDPRTWAEGRFDYSPFDVDRSAPNPSPADAGVSPAEAFTFDRDNNQYLSDDERDEDADGLNNQDEMNGRMQPGYWTSCYAKEAAYPVPYAGTSAVVTDSDGDGVRDGMDDQDHDDVPNIMELSRIMASHLDDSKALCTPLDGLDEKTPHHPQAFGWVNPFNPCLPDLDSRTCARYAPIGAGVAPPPFAGPFWWSLQ